MRVMNLNVVNQLMLAEFLQNIIRLFKKFLFKFYYYGAKFLVVVFYSVRVKGMDNIPKTGAALVISNHVSYLDGLLLFVFSKRKMQFVIDEHIYNTPIVKYFMDQVGAIPILPNRVSVKRALNQVSNALDNGELVCIFPEGSLTYTGNMMRFRFGIEWMLERNPVPVVPIALKGLWGSIFSRKYLRSKFPFIPRYFRKKIYINCGQPIPPTKSNIANLQRIIMDLKNESDK